MDASDADAAAEITIDVVARTLTCPAADLHDVPFLLDVAAHHNLTNGFDPIDLTQQFDEAISTHEDARSRWLPVGAPAAGVDPTGPQASLSSRP